MPGACEQFYRTWCYAGRSVSGADGWKIRAKSAGLPLPEAEGMADLANYYVPTRINPLAPPGVRLALFRPSSTQAVLAHGVLRPGLVGGRAGVSFEHVLAKLPADFSALEGIQLWRSRFWQCDDGDFGAALPPATLTPEDAGPEFRRDLGPVPAGGEPVPPDPEGAVAAAMLEQSPALPWAHCLQACLELGQPKLEKLFIAGEDNSIARLLYVVFYCLPEAFRRRLTFSTHENPKGTKGVRIVGVTTFEPGEPELPAFCYEGQYRALNLFTGERSEELELGAFAASAMDWLRCGQYAYLRVVHERFQQLQPADQPGVRELDLLSRELALGSDDPEQANLALELLTSRPLARARLASPEDLARLLVLAREQPGGAAVQAGESRNPLASEGTARESGDFTVRLASQLAAWLPSDDAVATQFAAILAGLAEAELTIGSGLDTVRRPATLARLVSPALGDRALEGLLQLCQGAAANARVPAMEVRLGLVQDWLALPTGASFSPEQAPAGWLDFAPAELPQVLAAPLPFGFKRRALESCLTATVPLTPSEAEKLGHSVCSDPALLRELFFQLPHWRQWPRTVASSLPTPVVAQVLEAFSQSLTLRAALRGEDARLLETVEVWRGQLPALIPTRLETLLRLGRYLRQPAATTALEGEIISRPFWWGEDGKEEAVNAALDLFLESAVLDDFDRALGWFGHGAWAYSPGDVIHLASQRLNHASPPIKNPNPALREVVDLLARFLREWDQSRKAALGTVPPRGPQNSGLGAQSIAALARLALGHLPDGGFLKTAPGRDLLTFLRKESHLIEPAQRPRFEKLHAILVACTAREPTPDTLLTLALSGLDDTLNPDFRADVSLLLSKEVVRAPKVLSPFLRKFFDNYTELCTAGFLPAFLSFLAERQATARDTAVTDALASALAELGDELTARAPDIAEPLREFLKKLPPQARDRFEKSLKQAASKTARLADAIQSPLPPAGSHQPPRPASPGRAPRAPSALRRRWHAVVDVVFGERAMRVYFYLAAFATGALGFHFRHAIVRFFKHLYDLK